MSEWQPIETAPKDGSEVLGYNGEGPSGCEIVCWRPFEPDMGDQPGHDAGWLGHTYAFPGRTKECGFGGSGHWIFAAEGQPTHWMSLPNLPVQS